MLSSQYPSEHLYLRILPCSLTWSAHQFGIDICKKFGPSVTPQNPNHNLAGLTRRHVDDEPAPAYH